MLPFHRLAYGEINNEVPACPCCFRYLYLVCYRCCWMPERINGPTSSLRMPDCLSENVLSWTTIKALASTEVTWLLRVTWQRLSRWLKAFHSRILFLNIQSITARLGLESRRQRDSM